MKRREALKSLLLLPAVAGAISQAKPVVVSALENPSLPIQPLYLGNLETVENGVDYWERERKYREFEAEFLQYFRANMNREDFFKIDSETLHTAAEISAGFQSVKA